MSGAHLLEQSILNNKGISSKQLKLCWYTHYIPCVTKFLIFCWGCGTPIAQTPNINHQYITEVRLCTSPDFLTTQVWWTTNFSKLKAGGEYYLPQHTRAVFDLAKRCINAIMFTKTPIPIILNVRYSIVDEAVRVSIDTHTGHFWSAVIAVHTLSVCWFRWFLYLDIDPHIWEAWMFCVWFDDSHSVLWYWLHRIIYIVSTWVHCPLRMIASQRLSNSYL